MSDAAAKWREAVRIRQTTRILSEQARHGAGMTPTVGRIQEALVREADRNAADRAADLALVEAVLEATKQRRATINGIKVGHDVFAAALLAALEGTEGGTE